MNAVIPLQGRGRERPLRSVLIAAGMWNIQQLADESGADPYDVADVLYGQPASTHVVYQLISVLNNTKGSGQWIMAQKERSQERYPGAPFFDR